MYDIIGYINRYKKLDKRIAKLYDEINDETSENQNSKSYDNKMIKIHKLQEKAMVNAYKIVDYLDQNEDVLHMKRKRLFLLNTLIVIITIIMGINYIGIYKIIAFLISLVVATGNIIGNKSLKSIINKSEDDIEKIIANVESRNSSLYELRNRKNQYNFNKIFKIIEKYNIKPDDKDAEKRILEILSSRKIHDEEPSNKTLESQEHVSHTEDNGVAPEPKKKIRRIRRDRDKYV